MCVYINIKNEHLMCYWQKNIQEKSGDLTHYTHALLFIMGLALGWVPRLILLLKFSVSLTWLPSVFDMS